MWLTPRVMLRLIAHRAAATSICLAISPILVGAEALHLAVWRYRHAVGATPPAQPDGGRQCHPGSTARRAPHRVWDEDNSAAATRSPVVEPWPARNLLDRLTTLWARMEELT